MRFTGLLAREYSDVRMTLKNSQVFFICFISQLDEKTKTRTLHFPAKENPNMEKTLFDWPIVLQYDVKAINQPKADARAFVSVR